MIWSKEEFKRLKTQGTGTIWNHMELYLTELAEAWVSMNPPPDSRIRPWVPENALLKNQNKIKTWSKKLSSHGLIRQVTLGERDPCSALYASLQHCQNSISRGRAAHNRFCPTAGCWVSGNPESGWKNKVNWVAGKGPRSWNSYWCKMECWVNADGCDSQIHATGQGPGRVHLVQYVNVHLWQQEPGLVDNARQGVQGPTVFTSALSSVICLPYWESKLRARNCPASR